MAKKKKIHDDTLRDLIRQWVRKEKPTLLRNKIFDIMHPGILVIIKGILRKWGRFEEKTEVISLSWDAFLFSLAKYDPEKYQVWPHFRRYAKYFLLLHYAKEQSLVKKREYLASFQEVFSEDATECSGIDELKRFREGLTKEEQAVFDNVVFGEHPPAYEDRKFVKKKDRGGMSYYKYYVLRESFKRLIDHLLK